MTVDVLQIPPDLVRSISQSTSGMFHVLLHTAVKVLSSLQDHKGLSLGTATKKTITCSFDNRQLSHISEECHSYADKAPGGIENITHTYLILAVFTFSWEWVIRLVKGVQKKVPEICLPKFSHLSNSCLHASRSNYAN